MRPHLLLGALAVLAAVVQLIAMHWGTGGALIGGLLCGITIAAGERALQSEAEPIFVPVLVAAAASAVGLLLGIAGTGVRIAGMAWFAPLIAAMPAAVPALAEAVRGARCPLCHTRLRGLLAFACPRCHLKVCENCWQFERGRCRICEANQVALLPLDLAWWQERFKRQAREGRCALCMRTADWEVAHWACGGCGHNQCRLCWDDNNGQCSRCGWIVPGLPEDVSEFAAAGARPEKTHRRA
jgi:hypothetical protein